MVTKPTSSSVPTRKSEGELQPQHRSILYVSELGTSVMMQSCTPSASAMDFYESIGIGSARGKDEQIAITSEECAEGFWQHLLHTSALESEAKSVRVLLKKKQAFGECLAISADRDPFHMVLLMPGSMKHALIKRGMPTKVLTTFIDTRFPGTSKQSVFQSLGLSDRTVRRKTDEELLSTQHTDAAFALMEVTEMATEVLGDKDAAVEWLTSEALGLDNQRPIDLLSTSPGIESVKTLLNRIRFGVYA